MSDFINALNSSAQASTGTTLDKNKEDGSVMGKEDFMMLLVAQLKNQDPLNPDDPTEFTAQLAQFSSLEQLYNLNDSMDSLAASNADSDRLSTLGTIGKDVAYESKTLNFSGQPLDLGYSLTGPASEVTISLQQNGATLATLNGTELTKGNHFLTWDGLTQDGSPAPVGEYDIVISAKSASDDPILVSPLIKSEVTGVDLAGSAGGTLVTLAGEVAFNKILGVFEPGSRTAISTSVKDEENDTSVVDGVEETANAIKDTADTVEETINTTQSIADSLTT